VTTPGTRGIRKSDVTSAPADVLLHASIGNHRAERAFNAMEVMNMHLRLQTCLAAASLVFVTIASAMAADISGTWTGTIDTMIGQQKYTYTFQVAGDKITGTAEMEMEGEKHKSDLKDIKLTGDELTFTETLEAMGNTITVTYKGKISGDEIKFTRQVGEFATEEFAAKRVK
jgi:hypothetical protein